VFWKQLTPEQQPVHELLSHWHAPPTHSWPMGHAGPPPQLHCPEVHPSPELPQSTHIPPSVPQVTDNSLVLQVPFAVQHPEQESEVHWHVPPLHTSPAPHTGPPPQLHWPRVHPSALSTQVLHAPPPAPHSGNAAGWLSHVPPEQQPAHVLAQLSHVPPLHVPAGHEAQLDPCAPHCPSMFPGWHSLLSSQHPLQEVESQAQAISSQCWPVEHLSPPPHVQTPPVQASPSPLHE
jgi:hypothetical protein